MHLLFNLPEGVTLEEFNAVLALIPDAQMEAATPLNNHSQYSMEAKLSKNVYRATSAQDRVNAIKPTLLALGVPTPLDLIVYELPPEYSRYSFVRDSATTEVLIDQLNAARLRDKRHTDHTN